MNASLEAPVQERSLPRKLSKYQHEILRHVWWLDSNKGLLDKNEFFICPLSQWLDLVEQECFPATYQDTISRNDQLYYVNYSYCSGQYLEDLNSVTPDAWIVFQLRTSEKYNFYICLVSLMKRKWTKEWLVETHGAIDLTKARWNGE